MRNARLLFFITFLWSTPFWLGIWVLYYLKFTNYAGIGLIETVMIIFRIVAEIPTGAIADLFGKKNTLILATLVAATGDIIMSQAQNFPTILLSVSVLSIGFAFYSGTREALLYDSLKEEKQESKYQSMYGKLMSLEMVGFAVAGIGSGFLYSIWNGLPYLLTGFARLTSLLFLIFLIEPKVKKLSFTFANYFSQIKSGFKELFKTHFVKTTILLLSISALLVVDYETVLSVQLTKLGFAKEYFGIIATLLFVGAAIGAHFSNTLSSRFGQIKTIILLAVLMSTGLIMAPFVSLYIGAAILIFRSAFIAINDTVTSTIINQNTSSEVRATTISTFNMLKAIPYMFTAYGMGILMDKFSPQYFALGLGAFLLLVLLFQIKSILSPKSHSSPRVVPL